MRWHEFIFSEERKIKVLRHLSFWVVWGLYFFIFYTLMMKPIPQASMKPGYFILGHHLFLKTFLIIALYAMASYSLIYFILPQFIQKKFIITILNFVLLFTFLLITSHMLYRNIFPVIDAAFGHFTIPAKEAWFWPAINIGVMNFTKVATAAVIIKYLKYWWLKQKERQQLEKEKINTELQLLKAQVHPDFLFKTLNNIYSHALCSSPRTSGMLLKLSDLLSYMLYECDQSMVPLEKEIAMMEKYMQLEKIRYNDEPEIQLSIRGNLSGKSIAPFLLLPFIENSFNHCGQMTEQFWINMDIRMEGNNFSMKLTNGISESVSDISLLYTNVLANVQKRLSLLYPGKHELRMTNEQEMFIVLLNIRLTDSTEIVVEEEEICLDITGNEKTIVPVLKYATK